MRAVGIALILALAASPVAALSEDLGTFSPEAAQALQHAKAVTLYSLEPTNRSEPPARSLHHFAVLGKTSLSGDQAGEAIAAFRAAMDAAAKRDVVMVAACFEPRHAISISAGGHRYDYLLCYACGSLEVFRDGKLISDVLATGSPERLNDLLRAKGVPLSMSAGGAASAPGPHG